MEFPVCPALGRRHGSRQARTLTKMAPSPTSFSLKQSQENPMRICQCILFWWLALSPLAVGHGQPGAAGAPGQIIPCSSDDGEKHYCTADTRHGRATGAATQPGAVQTGRVVGLRRKKASGWTRDAAASLLWDAAKTAAMPTARVAERQ